MFSLTQQEKKVLLFLTLLFGAGMALGLWRQSTSCNACLFSFPSSRQGQGALDVNRATREELIALPEIGEKTADAILAFRAAQGRIASVDELVRVKGLSDAKVEKLKPYLTVK